MTSKKAQAWWAVNNIVAWLHFLFSPESKQEISLAEGYIFLHLYLNLPIVVESHFAFVFLPQPMTHWIFETIFTSFTCIEAVSILSEPWCIILYAHESPGYRAEQREKNIIQKTTWRRSILRVRKPRHVLIQKAWTNGHSTGWKKSEEF